MPLPYTLARVHLGGIQPGLEWRNEARRLTNAVVPVSPAITAFRLVLERFQVCTIVVAPSSVQGRLTRQTRASNTGHEDPCAPPQYRKPSGQLLTAIRAAMRRNRCLAWFYAIGDIHSHWRHLFSRSIMRAAPRTAAWGIAGRRSKSVLANAGMDS